MTEQPQSNPSFDTKFIGKMSLGGKIAFFSAIAAVIGPILPWLAAFGQTASGLNTTRGIFCLLTALAGGVIVALIYGMDSLKDKKMPLSIAVVACGGLQVLLIFTLITDGIFAAVGFGFFISMFAAIGLTAGGAMMIKGK